MSLQAYEQAKRPLRISLGCEAVKREQYKLKLSLVSAVWGNPAGRSARSARGLTRDAKAVSGKPEGTSRCGYEPLSLSVIERGGHQPVWVPVSFTLRCRPPTPMMVGSEVRGYDSPKLLKKKNQIFAGLGALFGS